MVDIATLASKILAGDRRMLARAITLVESARTDHRETAMQLLEALTLRAPDRQALRIGLSGTPGVGKSTFIESFGLMLTAQGLRVAVLAVDPSSARTGGSILGDKTRMERLSRDPRAFIRPSPSQTHLGGVARRTRDAVALCEAADFDVVLVETVGVGQSETVVAEVSDVFLLLLAPAGGDELQGVKRGIMEVADMILVNKADGDLKAAANRTCADYAGALRLLRRRPQDPEGYPRAITVSALHDAQTMEDQAVARRNAAASGLAGVWSAIRMLTDWRRAHGHWEARRAAQARHWFMDEVRQGLLARLNAPEARAALEALGDQVAAGATTPGRAATVLLHDHLPQGAPAKG